MYTIYVLDIRKTEEGVRSSGTGVSCYIGVQIEPKSSQEQQALLTAVPPPVLGFLRWTFMYPSMAQNQDAGIPSVHCHALLTTTLQKMISYKKFWWCELKLLSFNRNTGLVLLTMNRFAISAVLFCSGVKKNFHSQNTFQHKYICILVKNQWSSTRDLYKMSSVFIQAAEVISHT